MHDALGKAWTLQQLAARVGMSRSVFAERFKGIVGATPMEYLTRWRMLRTSDRLRKSQDSLAQIARSLGYVSENALGKAFRRTLGCSPIQPQRSREQCSIATSWRRFATEKQLPAPQGAVCISKVDDSPQHALCAGRCLRMNVLAICH